MSVVSPIGFIYKNRRANSQTAIQPAITIPKNCKNGMNASDMLSLWTVIVLGPQGSGIVAHVVSYRIIERERVRSTVSENLPDAVIQ